MDKQPAHTHDTFLIADIGGTNARFALVCGGSMELLAIQSFAVRDYASFGEAVAAYLQQQDVENITGICVAVAGPVSGDEVRLTNGLWHISRNSFCRRFSCRQFVLINDFVAQSMSVPDLHSGQLINIGGDVSGDPEAPILVVGPGTGLGAGLLVKSQAGWLPCAGEGGHMDFAPASEQDVSVWRYGFHQLGRQPSWEDYLSGSGLERLYEAHACDASAPERLKAREITAGALIDRDSLSYQVVQHFLRLLGQYAGSLAVATGARGGVYIAGGIVPRVQSLLNHQEFRQAFEQRGKMEHYMRSIPVRLVLAEHPGLIGAAAVLRQRWEGH